MTSPPPPVRWSKAFDAVLVAAFLALISAPGLAMVFDPPTGEAMSATGEKLAPIGPRLRRAGSAWESAGILKDWFRTRFGLRDTLIEAGAALKVEWLGVSSSRRVLLGKDGWLFFADERSVESHRRVQPFSPTELAQWRHMVDLWAAACSSSGARLVLLVPPDKSTVYADLMPGWATYLGPQSRLDQLVEVLAGHPGVDLVDVRPALAEARRSGLPVYYRTDTHWNELGAYVAARELALALARRFPEVVPPPAQPPASVEVIARGGDLARFLGLQDRLADEEVRFTPALVRHATVQTPSSARFTRDMTVEPQLHSSRPGAPIPRAVVYRDSFGNALIPHVAELFGNALYLWTSRVDPDGLRMARPDVVVVEILERYLLKDPGDLLVGRF